MKNIYVIAPVKKPEDIELFSKSTNCRNFYVYHGKFVNGNFAYVEDFIKKARATGVKIYVNFKHNITERDTTNVEKFLKYLAKTDIDGIFVNSYAVLEMLKSTDVKFEVIIDSYFDIHNLSGLNFIRTFKRPQKIIVTEEVYVKNLEIIKSHTDMSMGVDSDNLPWCAGDVINSGAVDFVVIKGKFANSAEIENGIKLVEQILEKPDSCEKKHLPFKHNRNCYYQTNHFSGEIINSRGENFAFSKYIKPFDRKIKRTRFKSKEDYAGIAIPKINLRLSSLAQLKELEKFIRKHKMNPVYSIEYGEIINTADLAVNSFSLVIVKVKSFCENYGIKFQYGTPRILIERDFWRVYNDAKSFCLKSEPDSVVINNIGYFGAFVKDPELNGIAAETGTGINLMNSMSIRCLNDIFPLKTVDFTSFRDLNNIGLCIKRLKDIVPNRKLTVSGNVRVPSLGLCPLNGDPAILSRLSCKAPCQKGSFAIEDPNLHEIYPFITDGFCRMHMFKEALLDLTPYVRNLEKNGINEFVIDLSSLSEKYVPILLTNFLNSLCNTAPTQLPVLTEHLM